MEHKTDKETSTQSGKSTQGSSGSGAYYPLDKKPAPGNLKKYLAAALLVVTLAGAGLWISQQTHKAPQETAVVMNERIALVNSITNLSDEYDAEADQIVSATPSITLEEARQNQTKAATAIQAHKQEQKEIVESPEKNPDRAKLGLYKGILSKCYIGGNDVHWVNENGSILEHVSIETPLNGNASIARNMIHEMGGGLVVVIYDKGYEVYGMDGKLIKSGTNEN